MSVALITGASAGLGAEFARQLAAAGSDLVLVARDARRLGELASELERAHGIHAEVLAADLLDDDALATVVARLSDPARPIDLLVNNAGHGAREEFDEDAVAHQVALHTLLTTVPLRLMHAALRGQLARGGGRIINVASVAGYTLRGVYGASKRWFIDFSRWADARYRRRGVRVTVVVPGFVRTEFHERMGVSTTSIPRVAWLDARTVVRSALRASRRGRARVVPTLRYRALVGLVRLAPARWTAWGDFR